MAALKINVIQRRIGCTSEAPVANLEKCHEHQGSQSVFQSKPQNMKKQRINKENQVQNI